MAYVPDGYVPGAGGFIRREVFTAHRVYLYVSEALSEYPGIAKNVRFETFLPQHIDKMVAQITTWCASGRIEDAHTTEDFEYPDGVWQMFKARHMPHWFVARFPVRMVRQTITKTVSHYFVCPHLTTDDDRRHIQFMATGTPQAREL